MSEGFQRVESCKLQSHVSLDHLDITQVNKSQFHPQNNNKRVGIPPLSPSLFPLSPYPYRDPISDEVVSDVNVPPGKTHRRSNSDIPFGFSNILQSSPPLIPSRGFNGPIQYVKRESCWDKTTQGQVVDHLFSSYINLNNLGSRLNSFRPGRGEDLKSNGCDSSDNEASTSSLIGNANNRKSCYKREGIKRSADGDIAPTTMHYRSVSMDSAMAKINFADESSVKLPPSPGGHLLSSCPIDAKSDTFSLEFGNGVFNDVELKKIMANENLAEMALADPKRVKRILANRQSAARSKERKMRYITELENKVQTLQTETTTLSAQLMLLQRDSGNLTSENNELKFRLQSMEEQAQLRNALNDTLTSEVQRLKMMTMELSGDADNFSQLSISTQMFRLHPEQSQQQNGDVTTTHE